MSKCLMENIKVKNLQRQIVAIDLQFVNENH